MQKHLLLLQEPRKEQKPRYTQLDPEFIGLDFGQGSTNACILGKVWQLP